MKHNYIAASPIEMWKERRLYLLHSRMGGYCVVLRNGGPAYLGTKVVEDGPTWRVLDDELDQLHRRIGQASGGFHEVNGWQGDPGPR